MQEKKKFMPTITNYLSDDDDFDECLEINSNNTQIQTNYKEWKKLQQTNSEVSNGKRPRIRSDGSMEPLGDISSSEETHGIEDNDPMFKIIKTLSDKEMTTNRRNQRIRKKFKEPSMFLLFSRMKHLKYQNSSQDWTFNELCRVTHSSWENKQPSELEELNDTLDQKIREYRESLQKFRSVLLPDANNRLKYKSWVSAAAANKGHLVSPVVNDLKESSQTIPERLQNLVGKASVYHASATPNKSNHNSRHSLFSFRSTIANNDYLSETSLNYVANAMETCKYDSCTNKPVQDNRWDGQYCSAKCLINDCRDTFQNWLVEQKQAVMPSSETNGTNSKSPRLSLTGDDEEIMQYLASPPLIAENNNINSDDDSEDSINRDENLFASLQQHYFPGENIVDIIRPSNKDDDEELQIQHNYGFMTRRHITDIDNEDNEDNGLVMLSSPIKLQNNTSQVLPDLSTSTNQRNSSVVVISSASSHSDR